MAMIKAKMQAVGNEPQTCIRKFERGEMMSAVEYEDGSPAGWHTEECVEHWKNNGISLCDAGCENDS